MVQRTDWDATLYDEKHSFVSQFGLEVVELLAPRASERVLDLGCGTGQLASEIARSGAHVVGIDIAPKMIERARAAHPSLRFEVADGADFSFPEPFDAVSSNAALHWMQGTDEVIQCVRRCLKPGGRFVAEFGGKGNIAATVAAINESVAAAGYPRTGKAHDWYFPSIAEFTSLLERHQFSPTYASLFDRPTPFEDGELGMRHWLEMFGSDLLTHLPSLAREGVIEDIENRLRGRLYRDGTWLGDYRRIRVVAIRE